MATNERRHAQILFGDAQGVHGDADYDEFETGQDAAAATSEEETPMPTAPARKPPHEVLFGGRPEQYLRLDDNLARLADREGLTVAQQDAERREFAQLTLNDLELSNIEAQQLHDLLTEHRLKTGDEKWTTQTQRWPEQSRTLLRERYGAEKAEKMRAGLQKFIDATPGLAKTLGDARDHPKVTEMLSGAVGRSLGLY